MLGQREVTQTIECPISLCVDFDGAGLGLLRAGGGTVGAYGQGVAIKPKKVRDEGCGLAKLRSAVLGGNVEFEANVLSG